MARPIYTNSGGWPGSALLRGKMQAALFHNRKRRLARLAGGGGFAAPTTSWELNATNDGNYLLGPTDATVFGSAPIDDYTIAAWYKLSAVPGTFEALYGSNSSSSASDGMKGSWGSLGSRFFTSTGGQTEGMHGNTHLFGTTDPRSTGVWHHVVMTFNRSTKVHTCYVDGEKEVGSAIADDTGALGGEFTLGSHTDPAFTNRTPKARLSTFVLWQGHVATDQEASDLYNSGVWADPLGVIGVENIGNGWALPLGDHPSDDPTVDTGQATDIGPNGHHFTPKLVSGETADHVLVADAPPTS